MEACLKKLKPLKIHFNFQAFDHLDPPTSPDITHVFYKGLKIV
jgi:hypothetical protein